MKPRTLIIMAILMGLFLGFGSSDLEQDRAECANQLMGLATCLAYVGGDAKAPTKDCCQAFGQVLDKSKKCICILIKDRNDPTLGLKVNATRAVHLPVACHQTAPNISQCVSLLNLPPNSPAAKDFESLGKMEGNNNATAPPSKGSSAQTTTTPAAASLKSDGWKSQSWLAVVLTICGPLSNLMFFHITL